MSKYKLIPEIRFPEFNKEWNLEELEQCLDYLQPTPYLVESTDYKDEYDTPVLTAGKSFILGYTNEKEGVFQENLPVIIFDDFSTATQFVDFPFKTKSSAMKILLSKNGNNIKFVYEAIQMINYEVGVHQRHWISIFSKLKIAKPDPQEQQKIASCLSSLDEVIAAHSQKLDLLKDHKKGLMQNLFPQEGEKVPKYRFKEFEGDWEKVKLKDVSTYFNGGSYENDVKEAGKYELITLKSIDKSGKLVNSKRYIDVEVPTLTKGTLIMILSEQAPGLLGMTAIIPTENKYVLNQRIAEIRPNQKVESFFLSMAINRNQAYFSMQGAGMKVQNITKPNVENYEFLIPEIPEQQKIASCLSSLDTLITAQAEKIEQLKLHKKGLSQGLFPKIND
jgi:type I restriction enzyme, S subunit